MKPDPSDWQTFLKTEAPLDSAAKVPDVLEKDLVQSRAQLSWA